MSRTGWRLALAVAAVVSVAAVASAQGSTSGSLGGTTNVYIVQLTGEPAVTYEGDVAGLPATKPARGEKIDPEDQNVRRYVAHLNARHDAALASVGGATKLYDYNYVINGFAAVLSDAQVAKLERSPEIVSIEAAEEWEIDTSTTPSFLGLTGPNGLWAQLGGPSSGTNAGNSTGAGEGIVVGIIDTGIWPEHPSVSDRRGNQLVYRPLPGNRWKGKCTPASAVTDGSWNANLCNNKLVGARFYPETREALVGPIVAPEFRSPRDFNGHGTHTGTTAAGNHNVQPSGSLSAFDPISGIAPRARIATYKACWITSCFTPDSAAAFDQAVADGVDVINFSVGGSASLVIGFVPDATRRAAEAGVFVAVSAGNSGPGDSTVAHVQPWVTTVAAGTHPRPANGVVTLGDGQQFTGASLISTTVTAPIIRAQDAGLPTADANLLRQCFSSQEPATDGQPQLDPAVVAGKIVICERGGPGPANARVDKSFAVFEAGGVGMVQINVAAGASLNADIHSVPSVHLDSSALAPVQAYAQTPDATATLSPGSTDPNPAPFVAGFSSRGPQVAAGTPHLLKPDVIAPGVDIIAGYSPASFELFNIVSGTSMSSPHVAGMAALLKHRHPTWTPMMIKSALMTTGEDILGTFATNAAATGEARRTFAQGAGHTRPTLAASPGLVFEHGPAEWIRYICGIGQAACADPLHPTELNGASVSLGALPGAQTVTRTARSVSAGSVTYQASFSGLPGMNASVTPSMFTIAAGASQALEITITNVSATLNQWQAGHLTLTPTEAGNNAVRIPIVVRPVAIAAPATVSLGADNNASWTIRSGVTGTLNLSKTGLQAATTDTQTIEDDPNNSFVPGGPGTWSKVLEDVPAGTLVRFELFDEDTDGNDDLDLYLFRGTTLVSASTTPTSREIVQHRNTAGTATYTLWVHAWQTDGPDATFTLFGWTLDADGLGTLSPTSTPTTPGTDHEISLTTSGLTPGTRYLGEVEYRLGANVLARTIVAGKAQ